MSEISSEYLFHYTKEIETIISILVDKSFKPFYCLERLDYLSRTDENGNKYEMAFPMVCFCDLTFNNQFAHRINFGAYGIALKKTWGDLNNILPVIYCKKESRTAQSLKYLGNFISKFKEKELDFSFSVLLMHYKDIEGFSYNKEKKEFNINPAIFYDEREWRYIPLYVKGLPLNLYRKEFEKDLVRNEANKKIQEKNRLDFKIDDIEYIILKDDSEVETLKRTLKKKIDNEKLQKQFTEEDCNLISEKLKVLPL